MKESVSTSPCQTALRASDMRAAERSEIYRPPVGTEHAEVVDKQFILTRRALSGLPPRPVGPCPRGRGSTRREDASSCRRGQHGSISPVPSTRSGDPRQRSDLRGQLGQLLDVPRGHVEPRWMSCSNQGNTPPSSEPGPAPWRHRVVATARRQLFSAHDLVISPTSDWSSSNATSGT